MSSATILPPPQSFGEVVVDGQSYVERVQVFTSVRTITTAGQTLTSVPVTLAGVAPFLLKGLSRDILATETGQPGLYSRDRRFRFNLRNSQASTWFFTGGLWIFDDRAIDSMCFGSGQFPYMLVPPVPVPANGTMFYDVEDLALADPGDLDYYPYTIFFSFHGTYLYPSQTP